MAEQVESAVELAELVVENAALVVEKAALVAVQPEGRRPAGFHNAGKTTLTQHLAHTSDMFAPRSATLSAETDPSC